MPPSSADSDEQSSPMQTHLYLVALLAATLSMSLPAAAGEAQPPATAEKLIRAAETQLAQQDIDGAIATLTRAVHADPQSVRAHTRLGGAFLLAQRYDNAIEQFQQAVGLDGDHAGAFIGLGVAYLHQGRGGQAKAALAEAKRLSPDKAAEIDDLIQRIEQADGVRP